MSPWTRYKHVANCIKEENRVKDIKQPGNTMCKICGSCLKLKVFAKHLEMYHSSKALQELIESEEAHHPSELDRSKIPRGSDSMLVKDFQRPIEQAGALVEGGWKRHGALCKYCGAIFSHSLLRGWHEKHAQHRK